MFWGTFLVKWNGAYYTKNVIIVFKIVISKCRRFSACASWFTRDQEGLKFYLASGNRVLDTFSMMQYITICCLCHTNIIMPSAVFLELSNSRVAPSQVTKIQKSHSEHQTLLIHIRECLGMRLLPNMLRCSCMVSTSELCTQSPSEALLHVCLQSNWKNI